MRHILLYTGNLTPDGSACLCLDAKRINYRRSLNFAGVTCDEVWLCVSSKMSKSDVDDALNFLCNEGYIHKTKRDHFKATDSES